MTQLCSFLKDLASSRQIEDGMARVLRLMSTTAFLLKFFCSWLYRISRATDAPIALENQLQIVTLDDFSPYIRPIRKMPEMASFRLLDSPSLQIFEFLALNCLIHGRLTAGRGRIINNTSIIKSETTVQYLALRPTAQSWSWDARDPQFTANFASQPKIAIKMNVIVHMMTITTDAFVVTSITVPLLGTKTRR